MQEEENKIIQSFSFQRSLLVDILVYILPHPLFFHPYSNTLKLEARDALAHGSRDAFRCL